MIFVFTYSLINNRHRSTHTAVGGFNKLEKRGANSLPLAWSFQELTKDLSKLPRKNRSFYLHLLSCRFTSQSSTRWAQGKWPSFGV